MNKEEIKKALKSGNIDALIEAHEASQEKWHEKEWREFIYTVREQEVSRILEVLSGLKDERDWSDYHEYTQVEMGGWNKALDEAIKIIEEGNEE